MKKLSFLAVAFLMIFATLMSATALSGEYVQTGNFSINTAVAVYDLEYYDSHLYMIGVNDHLVTKHLTNGSYIQTVFNATNNTGGYPFLQATYGLCFDGSNFYVSEYQSQKKIYEFDNVGVKTGFNFSYQSDAIARGIDCNSGSDIITVCETGSGFAEINLYDTSLDGNLTQTFTINGVDGCSDIVVYDGFYYALGVSNYKITEYDSNGLETGFFINITGSGGNPRGLAFDGTRFYTTDVNSDDVLIWGVDTGRILHVDVYDVDGNDLENILVEVQEFFADPSEQWDYGYTDSGGRATFYPTDSTVVVYVNNENYDAYAKTVYVPNNTEIRTTVILTGGITNVFDDIIAGGSYNLTGCEDLIKGVWLCKYSEVTTCNNNSDCATDRCRVDGHCSNFNYNLCDDDEMDRGFRCVFKQTFKGIMGGVTNWVQSNFLWVLIMVLMSLGGLIFALRRK